MLSGKKLKELCKELGFNVEQLAGHLVHGGFEKESAISALKNWQKGLYKPAPKHEDAKMVTMEECIRCGRKRQSVDTWQKLGHGELVKAYVVHHSYGCDSGCCGHSVIVEDVDGNECEEKSWEFAHPAAPEDFETWARSLVDEVARGVPLSWADCEVIDD